MNTNEAKRIRIEEYLHSLGYSPVRRQGNSLWYKSPFRDECEPSFKVNTERNLWYDFGASKGGNIIALAQELYASDSLPYLLEKIAEQAPNVRPVSFSFGGQPFSKPSFRQLEAVPLSSPALFSYLRQRGINTELAKRECCEVRYQTDGKPYFAVGFPNRSGGYEIRNKFFKGCIAPKDITHIRQEQTKETCYLFEGFMDYLPNTSSRDGRSVSRPCRTPPRKNRRPGVPGCGRCEPGENPSGFPTRPPPRTARSPNAPPWGLIRYTCDSVLVGADRQGEGADSLDQPLERSQTPL